MAVIAVGPIGKFATVSAALAAAVAGTTIMVASGLSFVDELPVIDKSDISIIGDSSDMSKLTKFGMTLHPGFNKATPPQPTNWAEMSKGIFTIKQGVRNTRIEGLEFYNAQIGSSYNAAGIRLQGIGLYVNRCKFRDCQNGVLTNPQLDAQGRPIGFVEISECEAWNNGWNGFEHDFYIGPCARQIVRDCPRLTNNKLGHHIKFNCGGGVAIAYNNGMMDEDLADPSMPSSHCGVDGTSGHVLVVNNRMRKVHSDNKASSTDKANYMDNDREWSDIGCNYLAVGNYIESTVSRGQGSFFRVVQALKMKDKADLRTPPPMLGHVARNVCRWKGTGDKYNYGSVPFDLAPLVTRGRNTVLEMDEPYAQMSVDMSAAPPLTARTMLAWTRYLAGALAGDNLAQETCYRTVAGLTTIEGYDRMEDAAAPPDEPDPPHEEPPVEIPPVTETPVPSVVTARIVFTKDGVESVFNLTGA